MAISAFLAGIVAGMAFTAILVFIAMVMPNK